MKDQFRARQVALWLNLVPDLVCEQLHDRIGLFQPLFLNLIQKHFFRVLSTPPGPFQELNMMKYKNRECGQKTL